MVGGSSQLILMQKKLEDMFPGKVHRVNNPDVAVAMGAARLAWLYEQTTRGGTADGARALTISDSVPIGLGISALNDLNQR